MADQNEGNRQSVADQNEGNRQSVEEDNSSTIPQPEGQDPIGSVRPSQAEGDRDTVESDLQDSETQG